MLSGIAAAAPKALLGTTGNDIFTLKYNSLTTSGKVTATVSSNGGVTKNLGTFSMASGIALQGLGGNDSVRIVGTSGNDVFVISKTGLTLNGSTMKISTIESVSLAAGAGNDTYRFDADAQLGRVTVDDSSGRDSLDFSLTTSANVGVNLSLASVQTVNQNLRLTLKTSTSIENVTGGARNDTLIGNALANVIIGGGGSDNLRGNAGNDTYIFGTASKAEIDTIVETSAGGFDSLNFGSITTNVTVDLSLSTSQTVHFNRSLILQAGANIETVTGGSGNDRLTGNARANVLRGGAGNDTLIGGAGSDRLIGGLGNDAYVFRNAVSAETDTVEESANGGTDTLFFGSVTKNVHVYLGTTDTQAVYTNMQLKLSSLLDVENVTGGSGNDTITGNAAANVLIGGAGSDSLLGRTGNDTYVFRTAASAELDSITELAGAGTDTLDFSAITTALTLNLGSATTQTIHTNRQLKLNLGTSLENVIGGSASDNITGNAALNVLVGNAGNDRLSGLAGRDILIGGLGLDQLLGGDGDDILIAGRSAVDLLATRLVSLQTGWNSAVSYNDRADNLRTGVGSPTVSLRAKVNVLNDSAQKDTLTGGAGTDWYFRALDDVIVGLVVGEEIDLL